MTDLINNSISCLATMQKSLSEDLNYLRQKKLSPAFIDIKQKQVDLLSDIIQQLEFSIEDFNRIEEKNLNQLRAKNKQIEKLYVLLLAHGLTVIDINYFNQLKDLDFYVNVINKKQFITPTLIQPNVEPFNEFICQSNH